MEFQELVNLKTRKLSSVVRFSGNRLIQSESVSDHITDMIAIGLYLSKIIPSIDKKLLVYKIAIHDYDECLYNDIPRDFKYHNATIKSAIDETVNSLMSKQFDHDLLVDIHNSKSEANIESLVVKCIDICQCTLKLYTEVIQIGNLSMSYILNENLAYLAEFIEGLDKYNFITVRDRFELNRFLTIIHNNVKHDFSKLH